MEVIKKNLLEGNNAKGIINNDTYYPPNNATKPTHEFQGTLHIKGSKMTIKPEPKQKEVHGKDITFFPDVALSFFTVDHKYLVPETQDVIPNGTLENTRSFWDMIVQAGRVWGDHEGDWSWASFPFSLMNRLEGESHIGIAMFLYNKEEVSNVQFQIVAQTAPFDLENHFVAWGTSKAIYKPNQIENLQGQKELFRHHLNEQVPKKEFDELKNKVNEIDLANFHGATNEEVTNVLQTGLYYDGVLYRSSCNFAGGSFPYRDEIRYGVWSVTKTAMMNVAMLRLAQKYGDQLIDKKISDYIEMPNEDKEWQDVTFLDMANMASGRGATEDDPTCYLCDYHRWYLAKSNDEKIVESLNYPLIWKPGIKYNYRDQDAFLLGVALENYLKSKEGQDARLIDMLKREVYEPIGIYYCAANDTVEINNEQGYLRLDFGYYATFDDLVKIASLYQNKGYWNGKQILSKSLIEEILPREVKSHLGVKKEVENEYGAKYYLMNWHIEPFASQEGCKLYIPNMKGHGGNLVTLMPNDLIGIRMANKLSSSEAFESTVSQAKVGNQLVSFCHDD